MKKFLTFLCAVMLVLGMVGSASALQYEATAGDVDYGADRDVYDTATNMDYFVFPPSTSLSGYGFSYTNNLGWIDWGYEMPFEIETANSGSMTVRAWDIDSADHMDVYFNFGSDRIFAGGLTGTDGGNVWTWESAVAAGTTSSLNGWSTTTFDFSPALLAALTGSNGFNLELDVQSTAQNWAAVIDYATINMDYEPGAPNPNNPVPEPSTILLMGIGLLGLVGYSRKRKKS